MVDGEQFLNSPLRTGDNAVETVGIMPGLVGPELWAQMAELSFQRDVAAETRFTAEQRANALAAATAAIQRHEVALAGGSNG